MRLLGACMRKRLGACMRFSGAKYMETLGCMYAGFGCMYIERLGACMRLLGAKYAVVGCMYMETFGCNKFTNNNAVHIQIPKNQGQYHRSSRSRASAKDYCTSITSGR